MIFENRKQKIDIQCMNGLELLKELPDESIDLIITDPPYNIMKKDNITTSDGTLVKRNIDFDDDSYIIKPYIEEYGRVLNDGGSFFIFSADTQIGEYIDTIKTSNLYYSALLIWVDKLGHPNIRKKTFNSHSQYIIYGCKEITNKKTFNYLGQKKMSNVLKFNSCTSFEYGPAKNGRVGEHVGHPTQKPTKLIKHLMKISSNENDVVLDCFLGSGTTAVCCVELNRDFIGCDISEEYYQMSIDRISKIFNKNRKTENISSYY